MKPSAGAIGPSVLLVALGAGCDDDAESSDPARAGANASAKTVGIGPPPPSRQPREGMAWIPGGALVAGTPPDSLPRVADEEMPGQQVILDGFHIDLYPHPNEEGAIPLTNVTQSEAAGLCVDQGKRLCTELEWERACKGPNNHIYEYGDRYRAERCRTGKAPKLRPSGLLVGCQSDFGVHDLHGGVWEWTSSRWGRGSERELVTVRGGNAAAGELVGRCANAMGRPPHGNSGTVGFRCCAGPKNDAEVVLSIQMGPKLVRLDQTDEKLARKAAENLPPRAHRDLSRPDELRLDRMWEWHPVGNEELTAFGGCSGVSWKPTCGVVITRITMDRPNVLGWASSGRMAPTLHADRDARDVWLLGADHSGQFKRRIGYVWGRVNVGSKERRVGKPTQR